MKITLTTKKRMYREAEQWADYLHSNPSYWASRKSEYIETVRSRYLTALSYAAKYIPIEVFTSGKDVSGNYNAEPGW